MALPFIDLKRFEEGFLDQWMFKLATMSAKAEFIGGSEVATLEKRLTEYAQVSHVVSCANGTDAIQLALRALGVGRSDLVLVPNMTFWATFEAVINVGASPITVDIDLSDGGIDMAAFEEAVSEFRPKAAVIAHLYGWASAKLAQLRTFCNDHGVLLLEDGAQCFGVEFNGESIYKNALISTTSFYPAKVLGAAGDGGAVFTNDSVLAGKVRQLGNHGRSTHYGYGAVGWNSRLDSLQAAFLNISLDYLPQRLASRRATVAYYKRTLPNLGLKVINSPDAYQENGYCNVCLVEDADLKMDLEAALRVNGIGFGNIYPEAMSDQPGAAGFLHAHAGGNNAQRLCRSVLNLPLFPYMMTEELAEVTNTVRSALQIGQ
jgi:UDP-2-acetamido-2-deoxy-ribo-hexuluronate aminotransferase